MAFKEGWSVRFFILRIFFFFHFPAAIVAGSGHYYVVKRGIWTMNMVRAQCTLMWHHFGHREQSNDGKWHARYDKMCHRFIHLLTAENNGNDETITALNVLSASMYRRVLVSCTKQNHSRLSRCEIEYVYEHYYIAGREYILAIYIHLCRVDIITYVVTYYYVYCMWN